MREHLGSLNDLGRSVLVKRLCVQILNIFHYLAHVQVLGLEQCVNMLAVSRELGRVVRTLSHFKGLVQGLGLGYLAVCKETGA